MTINDKLCDFERHIQYTFKDKKKLRTALTHKSYAYEHMSRDMSLYNERLEYLGDAILEHIISEVLFNHVPLISEGDMTKKRAVMVCEKSLSDTFLNIKGDEYILLGKCEIKTSGNSKNAILADAYEALIGAIYLDAGYDVAKHFVLNTLKESIDKALNATAEITDYKTALQELLQKNGNVNIKYETIEEKGPDHDKTFIVRVVIDNKEIGQGIGKSKKIAEQKAAEYAFLKLMKGQVI